MGRRVVTLPTFLSYAELGSMFDHLATMYDALAAILGLGEVEALRESLRTARLARERAFKGFKAQCDDFLGRLDMCADERASAAARALRTKPPDFETVEFAIEGLVEGADLTAKLEKLRKLSRLAPPDAVSVVDAIARLEQTTAQLDALASTADARCAGVADLLEAALRLHADHDDSHCPVCGTADVLDVAWRARAMVEVKERRHRANGYEVARDRALTAGRLLESLAGHIDADITARDASGVIVKCCG